MVNGNQVDAKIVNKKEEKPEKKEIKTKSKVIEAKEPTIKEELIKIKELLVKGNNKGNINHCYKYIEELIKKYSKK